MAGKRKSGAVAGAAPVASRRSLRSLRRSDPEEAETPDERQADEEPGIDPAPKRSKVAGKKNQTSVSPPPPPPAQKSKGVNKKEKQTPKVEQQGTTSSNGSDDADATSERQYWLMKAEPETRLERGVDVKFSIDDLASRTEPEPWDGIRNYVARNNLRAMKKGDLAFFYHSNCKEPGIVGTMEIVQEYSPDLSAHDPKAPYYDPKSRASDPKWSVVHVQFRSKFAEPVTLVELRGMGGQGNPLQNMQMLKQTRLSVSKVSPAEWEHIMRVVEGKGGTVAVSGKK